MTTDELFCSQYALVRPLSYFGVVDHISDAQRELGVIVTYKGKEMFFDGEDWQALEPVAELKHWSETKNRTNCPNCGAPLRGGKCLCCGTEV